MNAVVERLHNHANFLDMKNKELVSQNAYLKRKTSKQELELLKRDAVIQIQGNVIKLLDDSEKTIETGLKDEINDKVRELEKARKDRTTLFLSDDLFAPKSLEITNQGKQKLLMLANAIRNNKKQMIFIEGHTDNVPVSAALKKQYPSNWEVSLARAAAVARFLQTQADLEPERLVVSGHGQYKPVASNKTSEGRRQNRRVEIFLGPPL